MSKSMLRSRIRNVLGFGYIIPLVVLLTGRMFWAALICFILSCMFWITNIGASKDIDQSLSLQDKLKRRLGVEHMIIWMRKKPINKVAFGGFAIPIVPIFVAAGFNESIDKIEATIHEIVHAHYFIYGFQSFVLYAFLAVMTSIRISWMALFFGVATLIGYMLFQEFITFNMTQRIAKEYGYETRHWTRYTLIKYVLYYTFWFLMIIIILVVYFGFSKTTGILLAILGFLVFNRFMLKVARYFNRRDKQNNKFYKFDKFNKLESNKI